MLGPGQPLSLVCFLERGNWFLHLLSVATGRCTSEELMKEAFRLTGGSQEDQLRAELHRARYDDALG